MKNIINKLIIVVKSNKIAIFSIITTLLFFYPQIRSGAINSGILYSGDVLGFYIPAIIKAHALIHTGSFAGAINYSLFNGGSEFYLSPNFFSYHPLLISALVLTPMSFMTLHFAGLILIVLLALCSYWALYYSIKLLIEYFDFNFYMAAFVGVMFSFSYHSASALSQPPFIFSTILLPWIIYRCLCFCKTPDFSNVLRSVVPILFVVLGGYLPLGMATLGFAVLILIFKLIYLDQNYGQTNSILLMLSRIFAPFVISSFLLFPFLIAIYGYHHSTGSSGVPNLFYSAHQLADTPQNWMGSLSSFLKVPGRTHEFSMMIGLIPISIFAIFIFSKNTYLQLSKKEWQLLVFSLTLYFMIVLSTYGDYSVLSDLIFYFVPQIGKMHIYQRFYLLANFLLMISVALMLKAVISSRAYWTIRLALGMAIAALIFVTLQIYSGESYIKGIVFNNFFLFEIFLVTLCLVAMTFPFRHYIFFIVMGLAILPSLNRYYDLAAGGNTLDAQYKIKPIVLDGNERVRFLNFLDRFREKEVIKYIDLTPMWNATGNETFPKDYPEFLAGQKKLSSYGGFTFYLSAKADYISRMPVTGETVSVKPDWEYLKGTGADFAIATQQNINENAILGALMQKTKPQEIYNLPGGAFAIPLKFDEDKSSVLFDNGFFRILPSQANIKFTNLALNAQVQQSGGIGPGKAQLAVDGNNDGNFANGSVSHTSNDPNAWFDVDLGSSQNIDALRIWNRTDCCSYRLDNYYVFVSDKPFLPGDTVSILKGRQGTWGQQGSQGNPKITINTGRIQGRYIRLQFDNHPAQADNFLSIAELEVLQYDKPIKSSVVSNISFSTNFGSDSELKFESVGDDISIQYLFWPNSRLNFLVNGKPMEFVMRDGLYMLDLPQGNYVIKVYYKNWILRVFLALMILFALAYSTILWPQAYRDRLVAFVNPHLINLKLKIRSIIKY
jgi:F5/8 type C domain